MKHSAWTTFRSTDPNRKPPPREFSVPSFKATDRNIDRWLVEECAVCDGEFDVGQVVVELGNRLAHGKCV